MHNNRILYFIFIIFVHSSLLAQTRGIKISIKDQDNVSIPLYRNSYALVVGVGKYQQGWPDLPNAKKDAREVSAVLTAQGFNVTLLIDPNKVALEDALNNFIYTMGSSPEDRLLFYFAGHGYTMEMSYGASMGYIVPADAPMPSIDEVGFRRKSISMQIFEHNAKQIQSKHVLYVFDSCFSGCIFALSRAVPSVISYKTASPVRQFITAGAENEEVPDKSLFKSQFLYGLKGDADLNNDGYITGSELGQFLQTTVVNYSKSSQHPQFGKIRDPNLDKGDFIFICHENSRTDLKADVNWDAYLNAMKADLKKVNELTSNTKMTDPEKISAWKIFLDKYVNDCPYSTFDDKLRKFANDKYLKLKNGSRFKASEVIVPQHMFESVKSGDPILIFEGSAFIGNYFFPAISLLKRFNNRFGLSFRYAFGKYSAGGWDTNEYAGYSDEIDIAYLHNHFTGGLFYCFSEKTYFNFQIGTLISKRDISISRDHDNGESENLQSNEMQNRFEISLGLMYQISPRIFIYPSSTIVFNDHSYFEYAGSMKLDFAFGCGIGFGF